MDSFKIREKFLEFFEKKGHTIVSSSSLIPAQDPTLLFTNAGMNQFKDIFLGKEKRKYDKATSIQKCVRAGGKHNDLDQVGFTARHLTFFEMMGNFSFGDYFKEKAISYAWEFLTEVMQLNKEKLFVTIYKTDDESFKIWHENIGISAQKIVRLGEKDNFWQMGDTGPCGPCTEIHIDRGTEFGCKKPTCALGCDCDRFLEIWNLVFMQYDRQSDGTLVPLQKTGVDTGMGMERLCMIMQSKNSVFEIDSFQVLIKKIEDFTKIDYKKSPKNIQAAFNVLIDHTRSSSLLIADGCTPSNEGRGYVLRKIIRRAALFAQKLSNDQNLFSKIAYEFINYMCPIYPELKTSENLILGLLNNELEKFSINLDQGQNILEKYIQKNLSENKKILSGKQVFKLYDTYGFPPELTNLIAKEKDFDIDMPGFEQEMKKQQEQSGKKTETDNVVLAVSENITTKFVGYDNLQITTKINFLQQEGDNLWLVTEESPFYVESGGQISDTGFLNINNEIFKIEDFKKLDNRQKNPAIAVKIFAQATEENIKIGDNITCIVDNYSRINTTKNHTSAHLLQAALRQILGSGIKQAGSSVNDSSLRFDFTYHKALTQDEIEQVEILVNNKIQENIKLDIFYTTLEKAKDSGVTAIFGEKYNPEEVRVIKISDFSAELCGGTHVKSTGDIGCFKILSETALSSGVRRITAITGPVAIKTFQQDFSIIKNLCEIFKTKTEDILQAINKQQEKLTQNIHEIKTLKKQLLYLQVPIWQKQIFDAGKTPFLFLELEELLDNGQLKDICQQLEQKTPGFYFLTCKIINSEKINFFGYLNNSYENKIDLKEFSLFLKEKFNLKGGVSKNLIQGGGEKVNTNELKQQIINWLKIR
ncbi:MAG: alanine--tRNA ligase [Candidatus Babeliales bacterium]